MYDQFNWTGIVWHAKAHNKWTKLILENCIIYFVQRPACLRKHILNIFVVLRTVFWYICNSFSVIILKGCKWIYERSYIWTAEKDEDIADHRSYIHNLSSCVKLKPENMTGLNGLNRIWTHDLCDIGKGFGQNTKQTAAIIIIYTLKPLHNTLLGDRRKWMLQRGGN